MTITFDADDVAYFDEVHGRRSEALCPKPLQVVFRDGDAARPNDCHANAVRWAAQTPDAIPVHGWLIEAQDAFQLHIVAHSVVADEHGRLADEAREREGWKWAEPALDYPDVSAFGRVYPVAVERSAADAAEITSLSEEYDRIVSEAGAEGLSPEADARLEEIDKALQAFGPDFDYAAEAKRFRLTPRCVVWDLSEVQAWLEKRRRTPVTAAKAPDVRLRRTRPVHDGPGAARPHL